MSNHILAALALAISKTVAGADVGTVCGEVDTFIDEELQKTCNSKKSKKLERGIAFPTCLSINEVCGHYSPLPEDSCKLKDGDLVSIEVGAHMDGFAALAAHTIIVGGATKGRQADCILAAHNAMMACAKSIGPGVKNQVLTDTIEAVCKQYNCEPLHGVLSYKNKRHMVDGGDCIANKHIPESKPKDWEFAPGDVICLDIYVSTGSGISRQAEARTTVFKRNLDVQYILKSKHARAFLTIVNKKYPTLPFSIRGFEDPVGTKVGVKECVDHELLDPYGVMTEKPGEFCAQFKCTVVVQPKSTVILAGGNPLTDKLDTENSIQDEQLKKTIAGEFWKREEKKKAKDEKA